MTPELRWFDGDDLEPADHPEFCHCRGRESLGEAFFDYVLSCWPEWFDGLPTAARWMRSRAS